MSELIVRVTEISKDYEKSEHQSTIFKEWLTLRLKQLMTFNWPSTATFNVLDAISFDVHKGEIVGLLGKNGSGKSTLLKILSRITPPTKGEANIYGSVASIIEVGAGFHRELSGRENMYLNGAMLGMKRDEVNTKLKAIVQYAEIDEIHMDLPIKKFSSGMKVRLAFAVAVHLSASLLLLDEVLAVSDLRFQQKSLRTLKELAAKGKTILFVTHDLQVISDLCTRLLILDKGVIDYDGPVGAGIKYYMRGHQLAHKGSEMPSYFDFSFIRFDRVRMERVEEDSTDHFVFRCNYQWNKNINRFPDIGIRLIAKDASRSIELFSLSHAIRFKKDVPGFENELECSLKGLNLKPGIYPVDLELKTTAHFRQQQNFTQLIIGDESQRLIANGSDLISISSKWKG